MSMSLIRLSPQENTAEAAMLCQVPGRFISQRAAAGQDAIRKSK